MCTQDGCPELHQGSGRCPECRRSSDLARGSAAERGYKSKGHKTFRAAVLQRDPICVLCLLAASTVADHYPLSRRELVDAQRDPNDPAAGRGLCKRCHDTATARHQPGGWNARA